LVLKTQTFLESTDHKWNCCL